MSILRYPGGKTRAIKTLEQYLPKQDFNVVLSPFFGGGSFELYMKDKLGKTIVANDKFEPLYNFWNNSKESKDEIVATIKELLPITKESFHQYRKDLFSEHDKLLRACYYYIINRSSFSGTTCSGGFSEQAATKRLTTTALDRLSMFNTENIEFMNLDFTDFLQFHVADADTDSMFVFADPPYFLEKNSKLYGKQGDLHEEFDHKMLYKIIKQFKTFMLCYNDCAYIRDLYKDYHIYNVQWSYGMNKSKKSSEILILSYTVL